MITCPETPIPYLPWHAEARRRAACGERQVRCPECQRWVYPQWLADRAGHGVGPERSDAPKEER